MEAKELMVCATFDNAALLKDYDLLLEKPIAPEPGQCRELSEIAQQRGRLRREHVVGIARHAAVRAPHDEARRVERGVHGYLALPGDGEGAGARRCSCGKSTGSATASAA